MTPIDLTDPSLYLNRELSRLEFNRRVLAQAQDASVPILERLRFLCIFSSNLDEFFEIRVAGLKEQIAYGVAEPGPDGLNALETLRRIADVTHALVQEQYATLQLHILPELAAKGIRILRRQEFDRKQKRWIARFFESSVAPVLTPIGLDPAHPFPRPLNKLLNFMVRLEGRDAFGRTVGLATVQAPRSLPRVIQLPSKVTDGPHDFVMLGSVIHENVESVFPGMTVTGSFQFRVTRNSDLWVETEEVDDLMRALKGELPQRNFGEAVRVEVADTCPADIAEVLLDKFNLTRTDLYQVNGPVNVYRLSALYQLVDRPDLKFRPHHPGLPKALAREGTDLFAVLRRQDVILHHPYESFLPVLEMLRTAANDPEVLAIKQTLYRTGVESPFVDLLIEASRAGKEVTAVVELRARFDEAANIDLATRLQNAGVTVVYGVVGYKTHGKMLMIVRREGEKLRRYVHLGTGNYHRDTARAYTDLSFMTADRDVGEDVHALFQQLTGFGRLAPMEKLLHAPFTLHKKLLQMIEKESDDAAKGKEARITARMNALTDPDTIRALYAASQAGVHIDLLVRGACCLRPGIPGVSERIRVRSIVDRFLEHSRVFCFHCGGERRVFISSADWMPRNFHNRVEVCVPIEDERLRDRVVEECLTVPLADTSHAWTLRPDGAYARVMAPEGQVPRSAQAELIEKLSD